MARVKGGDVLLQLMDTVAQLEATAKQHAEQLEAIAKRGIETSARVTGLGSQVAGLGSQLTGLAISVESLGTRVTALEEDLAEQAQNFVEASKTARTNVQQLARLARLIGELADGSERRFGRIENRLTALEKKSG